MTIIISALKIIILLGFLIFIHELGHMITAKICKVKVKEFAIGFGPVIFEKQGKETKYQLRLIPLGGFCNMEGEEIKKDVKGSFSNASILKKISIVSAGAIVNIIFGILIYFILMLNTGNYITNKVDKTIEGYVANEIKLEENDEIIKIDEKEVKNKSQIDEIIAKNNKKEIKIEVKRNEEIKKYNIQLTKKTHKYTGIYINNNSEIIKIEDKSPAKNQGLKENDKILKINDQKINEDSNKVLELIQKEENKNIKFTVLRNKKQIEIEIKPEYKSKYYLGIKFKQAEDTLINHIKYAKMETKQFIKEIMKNIKNMIKGNISLDDMMGPVGISEVVAKTNSIQEFIYMMALISFSLGITNLLPIPALDGGKILILLIEAIRKKPMKQETEYKIQLIGIYILLGLSIYITYKDIIRILK